MNRREFLKSILTATAAAAVAGLRPRPEPTEVVTRLGRGSPLWLDFEGIDAEVVARAIAAEEDREINVGVDDPTGIIPPTVLERYYQLVALGLDREQAYMQAVLEEGECIMESA